MSEGAYAWAGACGGWLFGSIISVVVTMALSLPDAYWPVGFLIGLVGSMGGLLGGIYIAVRLHPDVRARRRPGESWWS